MVVSNRGPYRHETSRGRERWVRAAGGLVAALDPVLQKRGGVWVSAKPAKDFDSVTVPAPHLDYDLAHVSLKRSEQRGFYEGVSNAVLWPLLHGFEPTIQVGEAPWSSYVNANQEFAETAAAMSSSGDLFWIQDYHLMLVPGLLRAKRPKARIGWFCHIPWPPPDTFGILPWREEILEGLLGADVLGFHLPEYAEHFVQCVERFTAHSVSRGAIQYRGRKVTTIAAPIGIPVDELEALAIDPDVSREVERIRQTMGNRQIVLGVDRLDYTKGIPDRLAAFERLLKKDKSARARRAGSGDGAKSHRRESLRRPQGGNRPDGRRHQRALRRHRPSADPLPLPQPQPTGALCALPSCRCRLGDTTSRRHEPGRSRVCGSAHGR